MAYNVSEFKSKIFCFLYSDNKVFSICLCFVFLLGSWVFLFCICNFKKNLDILSVDWIIKWNKMLSITHFMNL